VFLRASELQTMDNLPPIALHYQSHYIKGNQADVDAAAELL